MKKIIKKETKAYEKPIHLNMSFDKAMEILVKIKPVKKKLQAEMK